MNEIEKAIYLLETFKGNKTEIIRVIHEILHTANNKESIYYKKVRNIVMN